MSEIIGIIITCIAVYGAWLNNRMIRYGFLLWIVSNILSAGIHVYYCMWAMAVRDLIFLVLAVQGFSKWTKSDYQLATALADIDRKAKKRKRRNRRHYAGAGK